VILPEQATRELGKRCYSLQAYTGFATATCGLRLQTFSIPTATLSQDDARSWVSSFLQRTQHPFVSFGGLSLLAPLPVLLAWPSDLDAFRPRLKHASIRNSSAGVPGFILFENTFQTSAWRTRYLRCMDSSL
jgi:hypothetical protein